MLNGLSCERDLADKAVWPRLSRTNSSKLDMPMLNAGSPMKLYEELPPPETAQDPPQPPPYAQGRELNANATARSKMICLVQNPIDRVVGARS